MVKEKSNLKEIFKVREDNLINLFKLKTGHHPSDGKFREDLIKVMLDVIPQKYCKKGGFVIDSQGNISKEIDLIIYDEVYVPRFFMETYSLVPIESVVAIVQVKTTLDSTKLKDSIKNLNSIDDLEPKKGGKIISASGGEIVKEKRFVNPLKILVVGMSKTELTDEKCKEIDIVYSIAENTNGKEKNIVKIKNIKGENLVSKEKSLKDMKEARKKNDNFNNYKKSKLFNFYMGVLKYITLINNAVIINYDEYLKATGNNVKW